MAHLPRPSRPAAGRPTPRVLAVLTAGLLLLLALLACGPAAPATSSAERATNLAVTVDAVLTENAAAGVTPASPTVPPAPDTAVPADTEPPPTSSATATPAPPVETATPDVSATPCVDLSTFDSDVTVPDGTHFAPGAAFIKTWRLTNAGTCTWTPAYQLRHVAGAQMNAAPVNLAADVPPGSSVDIAVALVAPASNGTHIGRFQLFNTQGVEFGTRPYVEIRVP